jgi:hypothetical protein
VDIKQDHQQAEFRCQIQCVVLSALIGSVLLQEWNLLQYRLLVSLVVPVCLTLYMRRAFGHVGLEPA